MGHEGQDSPTSARPALGPLAGKAISLAGMAAALQRPIAVMPMTAEMMKDFILARFVIAFASGPAECKLSV